jgi:hypothetical protein
VDHAFGNVRFFVGRLLSTKQEVRGRPPQNDIGSSSAGCCLPRNRVHDGLLRMTVVGACHSEGGNVKQVAGQRLESNILPEDPKFEATEESSLSSRQGTCHSEGVAHSIHNSLMVEKKNIFAYVDGNLGDRRISGLESAVKISFDLPKKEFKGFI